MNSRPDTQNALKRVATRLSGLVYQLNSIYELMADRIEVAQGSICSYAAVCDL